MTDFETTLQNIDIFCKVLVGKMIENESREAPLTVEPVERMLHIKHVEKEQVESTGVKHFVPLPHAEEPLVDVFEDDDYVKIFIQSRCNKDEVKVRRGLGGIELCKRECHKDENGLEICFDSCRKMDLSPTQLNVDDMVTKCNNNKVFEVNIPKSKNLAN